MVVVATSNTGDPVIISDAEIPANGTFAIYLNPEIISGPIKQPMTGLLATAGDISIGTHIGETVITFNFQNCTYTKGGSGGDWEIFLRAIAYWGDNANNTLLFLQILDKSSYNIAKFAVTPYSAVSQIKGRISGSPQVEWSDANVYRFNLQFVRLTL